MWCRSAARASNPGADERSPHPDTPRPIRPTPSDQRPRSRFARGRVGYMAPEGGGVPRPDAAERHGQGRLGDPQVNNGRGTAWGREGRLTDTGTRWQGRRVTEMPEVTPEADMARGP